MTCFPVHHDIFIFVFLNIVFFSWLYLFSFGFFIDPILRPKNQAYDNSMDLVNYLQDRLMFAVPKSK